MTSYALPQCIRFASITVIVLHWWDKTAGNSAASAQGLPGIPLHGPGVRGRDDGLCGNDREELLLN